MRAFKKITSIAAHLPIANIDTDMIIPKQYLKTIKRTGLGKCLFAELRYDEADQLKADFVLNKPAYQRAGILLTEKNFGCGSSREHAVWSLLDFGIQVIIAPSFADIFYDNCFKNGLLPIQLSSETIQSLVIRKDKLITVDLESQWIQVDSLQILFSIDSYRRDQLLQGLDEINRTLVYEPKITAFEQNQKRRQPWLYVGEKND
ncbi:3-isopropylmalate dehydratase small subunit [Legionella tunisiensis]|uniref:3-isopropylmalate dehydratase small subunit n=1 Tax=Legionella tunisiensis TaxID=1034944 RepID=UPI00030357B6|nr:3-isopropylmalate dehydratase small subunit [Legionella tunisiensis]